MSQPPNSDDLAKAVGAGAAGEVASALKQLQHCLNQLSDEQIWSRENESRNSIGNLILHLSGNLHQWIVSGISGAPDVRDRPSEFSQRSPIAKSELLDRVESTVRQAIHLLQSIDAQALMQLRHVQDRDISGLAAILKATCHFSGHAQEIIHMTRSLLGDNYRFLGRSATSH